MPHSWRTHPRLQGRFHPDFPDDVQVLVHDGGSRLSADPPELVWVRITGAEDELFTGGVLNAPMALKSVREGDTIRFLLPPGCEYPLFVTEKYLSERPDWIIHACQQCGMSEIFDAPSDLVRKQFPDAPPGAVVEAFTVLCPMCNGTIVLEHKPEALPT
jgi:hypothetical protein